ncbi:MAG: hypothetical protein ACO24P_00185 [Candidatus Nanopelagicaceae bacterium]
MHVDFNKTLLPGALGPFIDDTPLLTHAHIRPHIIAILLHRGGVRFCEVVSALAPHCAQIDLKVGAYGELEDCDPDLSRLENLINEVLGEMVGEQILRYNDEKEMWVLSLGENRKHLTTVISWASVLGGQIPHHLLIDPD